MAKEGKAVNLTALYAELNQQGQSGEYDRALKTANKILQVDHNDITAFQCKIVCLIQLVKFQDALKHLNNNAEMAESLVFEKGYVLYRLNRTDESLEVLRSMTNPNQKVQELLAQVLYRKEEYEEALSIYKDLIKNTQDDFEEERSTNLSAVMAALQMWDGQEVEDLGIEDNTYELSYNVACGYLGHGQYEEAISKLKTAESLCRQQFEDDSEVTPDEVEAELADIRVQLGYALQQLGRNDEALKSYNMVIKARPSDVALTAVASNNIITLNKDQNVFDSQKRIKALQAEGLQQKLTKLQKQALTLNQSLFYLLQNKGDLCRKSLHYLRQEEPDSDLPAMIEAALYSKEKNYAKAAEILQTECDRSESLQLRLAKAQVYLAHGQLYKACEALRNLGDDSYKVGVVSALVVLYISQEDYDAASEVLVDSVKWYMDNESNSPQLTLLMRANANFQLTRGNARGATAMLEVLRKQAPGDMNTLAQLISAYSKFDPKKAQLVSRELPIPKNLSQVVDVDSLESSANLGHKYIKKTMKTEQSPAVASPKANAEDLTLKKKKKKKKIKLPKYYNPKESTDPERWLPLRERTYFKGKRKNKKLAGVGKGTQGFFSAAQAAEFDKSVPAQPSQGATGDKHDSASGPTSPKAGSGPGSGTGPRQNKPMGAKQQKKKKKGGKW